MRDGEVRLSDELEHSGVRHWTDILARTRFGTQLVAGKKITSATIKAVGNRMASYADYRTGTRVRPGLARLAVDLEMSHQTVKNAVTVLRRTGFLKLLTRAGEAGGTGGADLYQLVIPADLLDREDLDVHSPAQHDREIQRVRHAVSGRGTQARTQVPAAPALDDPQPVDNPRPQAVDNPATQVPTEPAQTRSAEPNAGGTVASETANAGGTETATQVPTAPAISHLPTTTPITQPVADVGTAVTARASPPVENPHPNGGCRDPGCAHGYVLTGDNLERCTACHRAPAAA